jgi:2-haloacid dehalogenase
MQKPLEAVLFDLGGVLVDWDPRYLYRKIFADQAAMEHFLATVCTQEWNEEQDAGQPFAEGVRLLTERHPHMAAEIAAYHLRWEEMLNGEIAASVAIVSELRERPLRLFALTNWSAETFPIARRLFPFLAWFDAILISGEECVRKPDRRIFELAATRFGFDPAATLFIDDSPRNIEAAAALGFRTHRFIDPEGLRAVLVVEGALAA